MSPAAASRTFPSSTRVVNTASVLTALPAADVSATRAWYAVAADSPGMTTVTVWWTTGTFNESGAVARPYAVVGPYSTDSPTPAPPAETVAVSDAWCADTAEIEMASTTGGASVRRTPGGCACSASR